MQSLNREEIHAKPDVPAARPRQRQGQGGRGVRGICAIDLDTVIPGLSLDDFGDLVRFGANTAAEDETGPSRIDVSRHLFEAIVNGYVAGAGNMLTGAEWDRTWHFVSPWQPATTDSIYPVVRTKRTKSAFIRTAPQPD